MKTLLKILLSAIFLLSCVKANELECNHENGARCTGSASCTACSNCTRCAHCSSGGSCGVCGGGSSGRSFYSSSYKKAKRTKAKKTLANSRSFYSSEKSSPARKPLYNNVNHYNEGNTVSIITEVANVRKGPGTKYTIIEKVKDGDQLYIIGSAGSWLKIKVKNTGTKGYVYKNHVK